MAQHPYTSGQGALSATFDQIRKAPPSSVSADYFKKFGIAKANESYVISILKFLGLFDDEGKRVDANTEFLYYGDEKQFQQGLETAIRNSYTQLFEDMGDGAFEATKPQLVQWFRTTDKTSELTGGRQAATFQNLAAFAGHGTPVPTATASTGTAAKKSAASPAATKKTAKKSAAKTTPVEPKTGDVESPAGVGLSVRVEVNLPPGGDAETYDAIFASIKKHLMS